MVIFGAGGDLTKRLLVPALYNLVTAKQLSESIPARRRRPRHGRRGGMAQRPCRHDERVRLPRRRVPGRPDRPGRMAMAERPHELCAGRSQRSGDLPPRWASIWQGWTRPAGTAGNYLFYLAVADRFFATAVAGLGAAGLVTETDGHWRRVVIEKPFGHDLPSAKALNAEILKTLQEQQIYRIDHFLGKETVQNIMALRFANGLFEPLWNRQHIDHVQITAAETVGRRAAGQVLRDDRRAARHGAQPRVPAAGA